MAFDEARDARIWHAAEVTAASVAREAIEYGLIEAGVQGTETRESDDAVCVTGYSAQSIDLNAVRAVMVEALRVYDLPETSLIDLKIRELPDQDWLAEWKKNWRPVEVGRFIIAPTWIESEPGAVATGSYTEAKSSDPVATARGSDTLMVRIDPGMAFGTGTHETTRLCLRSIQKFFRGGSFLDVGTGTGILAIAAAKSFPGARVEALDTDAEAIEIAKENAELNGVSAQIAFRVGSVDEETASADLVCANLTSPVIVELLPALLGATCGRLILSGVLETQLEMIESRLRELGAETVELNQDGEWIALVV